MKFTREQLIAEIVKVRQMISEKENDCDGTVELLEDHLSCLLEDLEEELHKVNEAIDEADDEQYLEFLYEIKDEIESVL